MKPRDRFLKIVEWSDEDQCYIGSVPGWIGKCCHGDDEEQVYRQLCRIVDEWIDIYENDGILIPPAITGKKYSGKFQLRLDSELHQALAVRAKQADTSLNSYCVQLLKSDIAGMTIKKYISENEIKEEIPPYDKTEHLLGKAKRGISYIGRNHRPRRIDSKSPAQILLELSGSWEDSRSPEQIVNELKSARKGLKKLEEGF